MPFRERLLRTGFTLASHLLYRGGEHSDWAYEKMQRPATCLALALNYAAFYARVPRIYRLTSVMVEPVFGCNLRCKMCWGSLGFEGRRPRLMEWDIFRKLVDQIPSYVETVTFSLFGEPLLHPRLHEMIDYAADHGFRTILATNGTLLEGDNLARIAGARLNVISFSFETDADVARATRGIDLDTIRRNMEAFDKARRPDTEIKLYFVAREGNRAEIERVRVELQGLAKHIKVSPYVGWSEEALPLPVCIEPWRGNVNVFTNGNVSPCCFDWYNDMCIGNLYEQDFGAIVASDRYRALLRRILDGKAPPRCTHCKEYDMEGVPLRIRKRYPKR